MSGDAPSKTSRHTPGPWVVHGRPGKTQPIRVGRPQTGAGYTVANVMSQCRNDRRAEVWANASLIAAAPEMLEALKALLAVAEMTTFSDQYPAECEAASAAIAKATGEA